MFDRAMRVVLSLGVTLLLGLGGCGHHPSVSHDYEETENALGERESRYGTDVEFHGSEAEAELLEAKSLVRNGNFPAAIKSFRAIYRDQGVDEKLRAEALLRWAEAEGSLLNPQRDLDAAIGRLELFVQEFPESELLGDAERALARIRALKERSG